MNGIDEVISKVKKLYALAEANASEHEAAAAIAAAEKLLQLYRLSRVEVEIHTDSDANADRPMEDPEPVDVFASRVPVWQRVLISTLSSHYGCVTYKQQNAQRSELRVVGRPSDIQLFKLQYDRIKIQIDRLTLRNGAGKGRSFCDSYRKGLVVVIHERLLAMQQEVRIQASSSTALVKLDEREDSAWRKLNELHQNLRNTRPTPMRAYDNGYEAGRRDGHLIGLGEELAAPTRGLQGTTAD